MRDDAKTPPRLLAFARAVDDRGLLAGVGEIGALPFDVARAHRLIERQADRLIGRTPGAGVLPRPAEAEAQSLGLERPANRFGQAQAVERLRSRGDLHLEAGRSRERLGGDEGQRARVEPPQPARDLRPNPERSADGVSPERVGGHHRPIELRLQLRPSHAQPRFDLGPTPERRCDHHRHCPPTSPRSHARPPDVGPVSDEIARSNHAGPALQPVCRSAGAHERGTTEASSERDLYFVDTRST